MATTKHNMSDKMMRNATNIGFDKDSMVHV